LHIGQNTKEQEPGYNRRKYDYESVCIGIDAKLVVKKDEKAAEKEVVEEFHGFNIARLICLSSLPLTKVDRWVRTGCGTCGYGSCYSVILKVPGNA